MCDDTAITSSTSCSMSSTPTPVVGDLLEHRWNARRLAGSRGRCRARRAAAPRAGAQRPPQLDQAQHAGGQRAGPASAPGRGRRASSTSLDAAHDVGLVGVTEPEQAPEHPARRGGLGGDLEVLEHRHAGEHLEPLERAAHAEPGPPVGCERGDVARRRGDRARCRRGSMPGEGVEQRGLACAVRSDERGDVGRAHRQIDTPSTRDQPPNRFVISSASSKPGLMRPTSRSAAGAAPRAGGQDRCGQRLATGLGAPPASRRRLVRARRAARACPVARWPQGRGELPATPPGERPRTSAATPKIDRRRSRGSVIEHDRQHTSDGGEDRAADARRHPSTTTTMNQNKL